MSISQDAILHALLLMSSWEITAALLGVVYVILAAKESLWTWGFGFASTLIYTIIFWEGALVSSSLLNFYYMIMAVYGFYAWRRGKNHEKNLSITSYSLQKNLRFIFIGFIASITLGYLSTTYTDAKLAYMDSFVMVFSIIATWMLTQKILENWLYWLVIDSVAIILYFKMGYLATVMLFVVYIVLGVYAYFTWRKEFKSIHL